MATPTLCPRCGEQMPMSGPCACAGLPAGAGFPIGNTGSQHPSPPIPPAVTTFRIDHVGNGWVVRPDYGMSRSHDCVPTDEIRVFNTPDALANFVRSWAFKQAFPSTIPPVAP